jgi:ubiquinone/menaquinone biosynthesis C-methylase UbiE
LAAGSAGEDQVSDFSQFAAQELQGWSNTETAEGYVSLFAPATEHVVHALLDAVGAGPGMRVLDLCCGQGNVTAALLERGCAVTGLDFSPVMLEMARKRAPGAELIEGDAQDLPFDDDSFDAVISNFGICHVPDQPLALREAKRVLKSGGAFAMTNWCGPDRSPPFRLIYQAVQQHGSPDVAVPPAPDMHQFAQDDTVQELLGAAGFAEIALRDVETQWVMDDPAQLYTIYERGTVRAAMMLSGQPLENRAAIAQSLTEAVRYGFAEAENRYRVPVLAALVSARA